MEARIIAQGLENEALLFLQMVGCALTTVNAQPTIRRKEKARIFS